ncbi:ABC transporter substrate-binding protein [Halalkalibacter okhensis]|uniref:Thiamine pyrimidine synthase n=1 Tax=Halalkalibacter okhensis TaxID=333138 RepID=A0A0B0IAF2_9BACI|nr:ABC transporter substrate-binding protein [Halalkalibacter okhensis]KHF37807.1 myristoyl transferase [Halalkalibacter okhensis]
MKNWVVCCLTIIISLYLVGCSQDSSVSSSGSGKLEKVSIQIDGAAVPYYAPLYVAKEKGYFESEGLDVEFLYAGAADIVKNVGADNVEFGFPNADSVLTARAQEIPINVVHTTYQHGIGSTIFKKESGIETPEDLKGKTVAVTSYGSPNYIQLQLLLEKYGMDLDDIETKVIGSGSIVNALVGDEVDAIVFSMLRTVELQNQGIDVQEFRSDDYLPSHGNVLITSENYLQSNLSNVKGFINALNKGIEFIVSENEEEAIELAITNYAQSFEGREEVIQEIFREIFIPYLWQSDVTNEHGLGYADLDRWQESINILTDFELIENELVSEEFVLNIE